MQKLLLITDTPENNPLVTAFQKTLAPQTQVQVITPTTSVNPDAVYSPLTFNLPYLTPLFMACRNVEPLRDWVKTHLHYNTGEGQYWLPTVLTAKGPLYGEVIQQTGDTYQQPFHLPDEQRQPLYHLGYELLNHLNA
ncbi:MAG: fructosamine kinase family protein, partial [Kamptonema sp. SIO4C4]|nr:fructosamine kinase family protein [Kamptonema sp. SIO4C4]